MVSIVAQATGLNIDTMNSHQMFEVYSNFEILLSFVRFLPFIYCSDDLIWVDYRVISGRVMKGEERPCLNSVSS